MPCDLGYKSVSKISIEAPSMETIESRTRAPDLDRELAERLGEEDPDFLEWLKELDPGPVLEKALERALADAASEAVAEFSIRNGALVSRATLRDPKEKAEVRAMFARVARRWQMEVLAIVGEILDYALVLEQTAEGWVLEGEKAGTSSVREFLRIVFDARNGAELRFEHFKSPRDLEAEEDRFFALAAKLGVRIRIARRTRSGQDVPEGAAHVHPHKGKVKK